MAFKSLFTVLTDDALLPGVLDQAAALASAHDAHLDVLCLGVDRTQIGYYQADINALILQETIQRATADAKALEAAAKAYLTRSGVRFGTEVAVAHLAEVGRHVAARARFADLVVLPKPYGEGRGVELEPVVEAAMFDGLAAVLVVPGASAGLVKTPKRVIVAWNEGREALRAVRAALPLLQGADVVHVVVIDPPAHGAHRSDPGGLVAQYLARHGVRVEIDVLARTLPRVSDVLLRHATDIAADMVVMGAYGHSRFREAILGGATRNMLDQSGIAVFMAH